jgi:hypothetical protein
MKVQPLSLRYRFRRELGGPKGRLDALEKGKSVVMTALWLQELARTFWNVSVCVTASVV